MRSIKIVAVLMVFLGISLTVSARPVDPPRSAYMQAYVSLLQARALLDQEKRSELRDAKKRAASEVDAAIAQMQQMLHQGGPAPRVTLPPPPKNDPDAALRTALSLLNQAVEKILLTKTPEPMRNGQAALLRHIEEARQAINHSLHPVPHR